MAEEYKFVWGEVKVIEEALALARSLGDSLDYTHIETKEFDLDVDRIGVKIRIPHDSNLDQDRPSY